jgi:hypothetical protein
MTARLRDARRERRQLGVEMPRRLLRVARDRRILDRRRVSLQRFSQPARTRDQLLDQRRIAR